MIGIYGPGATPHWYSPPLQYVISVDLEEASWGSGVVEPTMACVEIGRIYCGPPARLPAVPTPVDLLVGAGVLPERLR